MGFSKGRGVSVSAFTNTVSGGPSGLERTFTQAHLTVGVLTIEHTLGAPSGVVVLDENGQEIEPDAIAYVTGASVINLISYTPISGLWRVSITP